MNKPIVAIFDDIAVARQVVEDLVKADFPRSSISLITNDAHNQYSRYLEKDYNAREDAVTAGEGAGFGAVVGGLTGILVGLAALMIPGIGLAIAAGPIVAGLTGALAGAATGGIVGALVKSGVPEDEAPYYAEGIRRGGTLISVETSDTLRAEGIINRYGSTNIHERINQWRQDGWKGFDVDTDDVNNEDIAKSSPEMVTTVTSDTTTARVTHVTHGVRSISPEPSDPVAEEEPPMTDEDTAKVVLVTETVPVIVDTTTPAASAPDPDEESARQMALIEPALPVLEDDMIEPALPVLEDDLSQEYEYTADDFQPISLPITNHPKG